MPKLSVYIDNELYEIRRVHYNDIDFAIDEYCWVDNVFSPNPTLKFIIEEMAGN